MTQVSPTIVSQAAASMTPVLAAPTAPPLAPAPVPLTHITVTVNGRVVQALVEPRTHLADFLREQLHLTGTHLGCEQGVCGACTVVMDGKPQRSCIAYALDCDGSAVTTIEGFDDDALMDALRTAFSAHHGLQCGFCTPGMLVTARDIVARLGDVPEARIREELSGNLCRCTGYVGIVAAIRKVCAGRLPIAAIAPMRAGVVSVPVPEHAVLPQPQAAAEPAHQRAAAQPLVVTQPPVVAQPSVAPMDASADGRPTLTERITLSAAPDVVWTALADLRAVASCVPGAEISAVEGDAVTGRLRVALGPIRAGFAGQGTVTRDEATRSGRLRGRGRDTGSGSSVEGEARYVVRPDGAGSELEVALSWRLTGSLAQFARTELVQALARGLLERFTGNLEALIQGKAPAEARPVGVFALLWAMVRARLFRR
jgi:aerobic-type carbon monoxide dehydrogenase small subunit (CoxS/CutS family)/carbon monoxide dehydrogenase subunit G